VFRQLLFFDNLLLNGVDHGVLLFAEPPLVELGLVLVGLYAGEDFLDWFGAALGGEELEAFEACASVEQLFGEFVQLDVCLAGGIWDDRLLASHVEFGQAEVEPFS
jgi:hypothetical protein